MCFRYYYYFLFMTTPGAYGSSQAMGQIGAAAATYTTVTATSDLSHICACPLWQCQILNPLSEAKDRTCVFMETMSGF